MEKEQPSQQQPRQVETMQVSSDCDVLQLCKQLQEIRAQLAKARAKAQVDGTVQDKAAAKLDEVCELLKLENQGDSSNIPKDETKDSVPTMTEHEAVDAVADEAVDAVADEAACGPAVCAANETVGYFEEPNPLQLIIDAANLDLACETVATTKDSGSDIVDRKPPVIVGRASDCITVSSPHKDDHCYAVDSASSGKVPPARATASVILSSEKRPAPIGAESPETKKLKTVSSVTSSEATPKGRVIVAGSRVPSGTAGPVIVRRCILQPTGSTVSQGVQSSPLPVASHSRVTMVVKAKDVGKPIRMPVHVFNQQSGGPISETAPQKLTIVHMKVLQQPPQSPKEEPTEKPLKAQNMTSKACQTTRIYRTQGRKKAEEVEQEPCTALVKTFPQPEKKGRRRRKNAITTQCVVFCCEACGDAFSAAKHLHRHWQTSHRKRPQGKHKCSFCNYSSDRKAHVKMHERTHTGERPYACYICQKGFYRADDVETHMRVHTKEKPYECEECGQRFNVSSNLNRHKKLHTDDAEMHACPECGKTFNQKVHLKSHMRTHTGERPYQCSQCNQRFTELGSVRKHERMLHAGEYPHYCPHCGKGLANNFKLKKHLRARHFEFKMVESDEEGGNVMQTVKTE
uniref:SCAN domain-containing zinc finger protein n=1 Tax=Rhipicephalus appendiculatus TaxID=34631 RepID=A0A131YJ40_RHIAP